MKSLFRTAVLILLMTPATVAYSQTIQIKLGTVAPADSPWYEVLNRMGQEWKRASKGTVNVVIYPNVLGDESEMLRKVRLGQIQGVGLSGVGLATIAPGVGALQLPMLVDSFDDLDRVRTGLESRLEADLEKDGFKVVNWSEVGWVHFFTKEKAKTPDDLKKLRLFITKDDPESEKLYRDLGFRPVPLDVTDLLTSLKTGLIDAFDVPPLLALSNQSFGAATHMINVKWAPLIGATIIDRKTWDRIPRGLQDELERIAKASGAELRSKIRASGDQAIAKMKQYGLTVETLTAAEMDQWRAMAKTAREKLRERKLVPADYFDEAVLLSVDPVSGSWTGDWGPSSSSRRQVAIDLKWDGKAVTGTLHSVTPQRADAPLQNATFNPSTGAVHFEVRLAGPIAGTTERHVIDGKLTNGSVAGSWILDVPKRDVPKNDFKLTKKP